MRGIIKVSRVAYHRSPAMKQRARGGRGDQREENEGGGGSVVHAGYGDITVYMAVASVVIQRGRFAGDPGARSK